ncbi:MAG: glycosyltransferase family 39 protein [Candidatus Gottesmanbacteria bacterium]
MKRFLLLVCILGIAIGFRFWQLGSVPVSLDWDETALGYNAYSILKTGRDEYGTFLPLSIRSFDDYKPPLYVYLTVPSVALFGLSPWSTRLPSAVMGVLAVLGTYFLVRELFKKSNSIPLISAALLAISPWHIQFSRIAFEANIGITVNIWAVTIFLIGLRKKIFLPFAAVLFGIGMYAYHSERIFLPLLLCLLLAVYWKKIFIKEHTKMLITSVIVGLIVVIPLIPVLFNKSAMMRLRGTSSFTDQTNLLSRDIKKIETDRQLGDTFGALLDNRRIVWAKTIASGYLSHFSLRWLFLTGDNPRHHAPDMGLLYLIELPFLLYGLYMLVKVKEYNTEAKLLIGWVLIAPVAASPTTGLPHAIRSLVFLPVFQMITAIGIVSFFGNVRGKIKWMLIALAVIGMFANIVYYLNMYFVQMNPEFSEYWQQGNKEAVMLTEKLKSKYDKVVVSTQIEQSYMFFLFYTKYDPALYLAGGGTNSGSFEEAKNKFDKYEFRVIKWSQEKRDGSILYVGAPGDMPRGNVGNITFLNGKPAIEIADQPNGAP